MMGFWDRDMRVLRIERVGVGLRDFFSGICIYYMVGDKCTEVCETNLSNEIGMATIITYVHTYIGVCYSNDKIQLQREKNN